MRTLGCVVRWTRGRDKGSKEEQSSKSDTIERAKRSGAKHALEHVKARSESWNKRKEQEIRGESTLQLRVNFAVAFLREMATTWWRSVVHEHRARDAEPPSTWDAFKAAFLARFRPFEASRTARTALFSMRQRGSVADYNNAFLRHMQLIDDMAPADTGRCYNT